VPIRASSTFDSDQRELPQLNRFWYDSGCLDRALSLSLSSVPNARPHPGHGVLDDLVAPKQQMTDNSHPERA
jgi:hypothetical protein